MAKALILTIVFGFLLLSIPIIFEPQIAKSATATDEVVITLAVSSEVTVSDCADFTMTGSPIPGITGGTATGDCTWTVTTNDTAGFSMSIKASSSPALATGSYSFADYTEANSGTPDYTWSVAASASEFGYTVEPATAADTVQAFLDDGASACNTGSTNGVNTCWYHTTTTDYTIINRSSETGANGEDEVVRFKAEVGSSSFQEAETYQATITVTVTTN